MEPVLGEDKGRAARRPPDAGFWHQQLGPPPSRPAIPGTVEADVCIVGAGYTGLWTAWALLRSAPALKVVLVEAQHAGFGASGRNGGWLSGFLPGNRDLLAGGPAGREGVFALQRALIEAVGSVRSITAEEGIDCDLHQGGALHVARNHAQLARLRAALQEDREWGLGEDDLRLLDAPETEARVRIAGAVGSVYSPHCARIQPAKLARGLATVVESRGATIYERSPAVSFGPGVVTCTNGSVRAPWVVMALEGYNASMPGRRRAVLPMDNSMAVTYPLPPDAWSAIGWDGAETVNDAAHAYVYMQRTADGRIAIGGRGVPYRYGSRSARSALAGDPARADPATVAAHEEVLHHLFPQVPARLLRAERGWRGVLGVARDWCPSVVVQPAGGGGGFAAAGGYSGDGVTSAHLAGLTLADLILGRDTARTSLPWVGWRSRNWEPEPLRWIGVQTVYALFRAGDRAEARRPDSSRTSWWARASQLVAGHAD